jgi:hypothetical protein
MSEVQWQKSSFSSEQPNCVEFGAFNGCIGVRESDDPDLIVTAGRTTLRSLLNEVKAGKFDPLLRS